MLRTINSLLEVFGTLLKGSFRRAKNVRSSLGLLSVLNGRLGLFLLRVSVKVCD